MKRIFVGNDNDIIVIKYKNAEHLSRPLLIEEKTRSSTPT